MSQYQIVKLSDDLSVVTPVGRTNELKFIHREIFREQCYLQHGMKVNEEDIILDVGANVGLFALSLAKVYKNIKIYSFEPIPPIFTCLEKNTANFKQINAIQRGIADTDKTLSIEFFPNASGNSTLYPDEKRLEIKDFSQKATLTDIWNMNKLFPWNMNKLLALLLLFCYPWREIILKSYLDRFFVAPEKFNCQLTTLDKFIQDQKIGRIHYLKVDVEGAEHDVFTGLSDDNLGKVQQIVAEVSPGKKAWLKELIVRLKVSGFKFIHCESMVDGSDPFDNVYPCNLYAKRDE